MTDLEKKYFILVFQEKICTYERIDSLKNWQKGTANKKYRLIDDFYKDELAQELNNEDKTIKDIFLKKYPFYIHQNKQPFQNHF